MENIVSDVNGIPMTSSLKVAKIFKEKHEDVIRFIETIQAWKSPVLSLLSFEEIEYKDQNGGFQKAYHMDYNAFSALAPYFVEKDPMAYGYCYEFMKAFNKMEEDLWKAKEGLKDSAYIKANLAMMAGLLRSSRKKDSVCKC